MQATNLQQKIYFFKINHTKNITLALNSLF